MSLFAEQFFRGWGAYSVLLMITIASYVLLLYGLHFGIKIQKKRTRSTSQTDHKMATASRLDDIVFSYASDLQPKFHKSHLDAKKNVLVHSVKEIEREKRVWFVLQASRRMLALIGRRHHVRPVSELFIRCSKMASERLAIFQINEH